MIWTLLTLDAFLGVLVAAQILIVLSARDRLRVTAGIFIVTLALGAVTAAWLT